MQGTLHREFCKRCHLGSSDSSRSQVIPLPQREDRLGMILKDVKLEGDLFSQTPWRGVSKGISSMNEDDILEVKFHYSCPLSYAVRSKQGEQ